MSGMLDETLRGIDEAIGQLDDAVREVGDSVNTARGQISHVSLISSEAVEAVGQAKRQVFKLADILGKRRVAKAIAAGFVCLILLANIVRAFLAEHHILTATANKKKRR